MKYSLCSFGQTWRKIAVMTVVVSAGFTQLVARPEPPAADRLMDPSKPENQGARHLFFHSDDETPPAPTPSEQAFKDFKKGPATFAEFCKLHPLAGKPIDRERVTIEVLAADVEEATAVPAEPTEAMLSTGNLIRQRMFGNSRAQTENVLPIDRQSDGTPMPDAPWEGERLFSCLEQTGVGYQLSFTYAESRVETWLKAPGSTIIQPVILEREMDQQLSLNPDGKWVALDGGRTRDQAADNGGAARKLRTVVYVRLVKN